MPLRDSDEPMSDVRYAPESGHDSDVAQCPLCAKSGLMQCSKSHSIR